jgi:hypothetical protein
MGFMDPGWPKCLEIPFFWFLSVEIFYLTFVPRLPAQFASLLFTLSTGPANNEKSLIDQPYHPQVLARAPIY